jgi:hypothetical protein
VSGLLALGLLSAILTTGPAAADPTVALPECGTPQENAASLISAIEAANANPGPDTIELDGCTYSFTQRYEDREVALPTIQGGLTIHGEGARLERAEGALSFGLFGVAGDLFMSEVTLTEFWGFNGAYISVGPGSMVLVDSVITNTPPTGQQDAALRVHASGTLAVVDTLIENQCNCDHDGGIGGAIRNDGDLVVMGSTFRNNSVRKVGGGPALQVGGAIENTGTAQIFESAFIDNFSGATGGAISNGGDLKIYDSSFVGNSANFGGAIRNSLDLVVEDSYFEDNDAFSGGAIDNDDGALGQIENSTFYRNEARVGTGGALLNANGLRVEHSTFSRNVADDGGDAVSSTAGLLSLEASIVDGGSPCEGTIGDFTDNLVFPSLGGCPADFTVGDPRLQSPALHGGDTKTMALGAGSAAIDLAGACVDPALDQRGRGRPSGPGCDAGAFEDQVPSDPGAPALSAGSTPNNTGQFSLAWTAATDPDDVPTYRLLGRDADDADFALIASPSSASHAFTASAPTAEGTHRYRVQAFDGNHASGVSAESSAIVVDLTSPSAPTATADRAPDYQPPTGLGWYRDEVTVSFADGTDPLLADGSPGSGVAATTSPQAFSTSGLHTATGETTDLAGNTSGQATLDVQVDADLPSVAFDACPETALLGSDLTLAWSASDAHSGLATASTGTIPVDTSTVGLKTMTTPAAADNVGHSHSAVCEVRVIYDFGGFFQPVSNAPTMNDVRAGAPVRISFDLAGDQGLDVLAPGSPASDEVTCDGSSEIFDGLPTESKQGLTIGGGDHARYAYRWETSRSWAGSCRQFVLLLDDGTFHRANFDFR